MRHYDVAPALLRLNEALEQARTRQQKHPNEPPSDAWRPDLTPAALTAAYNLPRYDAVWSRLREEYVELYKECERLSEEVGKKKSRMDQVRGSVGGANKQLEEVSDGFPSSHLRHYIYAKADRLLTRHASPNKKAANKLDNVPTEDMKTWMEDVSGNSRSLRTDAA